METRQYGHWWARHVRQARRAAILRGWIEAALWVGAFFLLLFVMYGR